MIQRQKGCNDIYGREAKVWKYIDTVIDAMMEKYNYNYIRTPIFEATELFHRGDGYIISPKVYGHTNNVNPLITIMAVSIGGTLAGPVGIIVALPCKNNI